MVNYTETILECILMTSYCAMPILPVKYVTYVFEVEKARHFKFGM